MNDMPVFGPDQASTKTALEDIAIETGTPIEVLFAAGEQAGAKSPDEFLNIARQRGQALGPRFKAGEDPTAIVSEVFGPEAQRSFGDYAAEIRSQLYGAPATPKQSERPQEANAFRDAPAAVAASVVRSGGSIVRGLGEGISAAADVAKGIAEPVVEGALGREVEFFDRKAPNVLSGVADAIGGDKGAAGFLDSFVSEEVKRDVQDFIDPEADLFDTSTWKMGARPTVRGAIFSAVDVFGSMAPIVAAGLLTGGVGAAATGGLMSGGFAADESGKLIDEMATTRGPDGRTRLEAESSVYQREIAKGATPEQAKEFTKRSAQQLSAVFASVPGALGGAATNAIVRGAGSVAGRLPWYGAIPAAGVISGVEEGAQEVAEGVAARTATNIGAGIDESITEGTLSEFVVGAMGGAPFGAGAAGIDAYRNRSRETDDPNAGSDQGAVPPGAGPASGPVPPVAAPPSEREQEVPTPTADVLRPQAVDPLDPAGQRPAAPSPVSDVLAGAPQPTLGGFQQGQPVQMQFVDPETGEISDPTPMTFVGEDVAGGYASFRAPDGSPAEVDLSEIASGNVIVSPVDAPVSMAQATQAPAGEAIPPAQPQAAPMPPIPAGADPDAFMERVAIRQADGMTPDQAYQITLQDALEAMREDVGTIADDVDDRQRQAREEQSRIDEAVFTDDRGQPVIFPTEKTALGRLGAGYTVEPFGEGFIGVRQQEAAGNEGNANDGLGGAGGITDGGRVDADRGGDGGAPVATGRDGAALGPVEQGAAQGVADATGDADADAALTPSPVDDSAAADPVVNVDQNPINSEAASPTVKDSLTTAPVATPGVPADVDYPNRKLNMRKARVEAPMGGMGDMNDGSFGSIALSNAREGDVLPGVGTVLKVTDKQIQITKPDGGILRLSDGEKLNRLARDMGSLIASSANLRDEQLGSLMDMIERDPTLTYRDGVPMLFDDPAEQANRGQRSQRGGILRPLAPTRQEVEQAAAQADPNPTEAQKEAGNYRKGHLAWSGLDLTIENAKGSERSGTAPDGKAWSVTMPADYGYFKRTESSDGDHVDFYMGDVPDSDYVLIVNQVDPETQKLDEHKVIIGTTARGAALGIYRDGFSDGSGNSRIGSFTETNVANLKAWLASGETKTPTQPIDMPFAKRKAETKAPAPKPDAPKRLSPKKQRENRMAKLREYFTPGNIVQSYGGTDRVISFNEQDNGDWTVTVEAVKKQGDEWVKDSADTRVRTHNTNPDARRLAQGPIEKTPLWKRAGPSNSSAEADPLNPKGQSDAENIDDVAADAKPASILSSLSEEKQAEAADLKKRLADKVRNQTSSGLDPEYITLGGRLVALYIEAGTKRFGQMLRDFAETTGLSMREAQAPMRAAYNFTRDEMDLDGQDVSDMDSADQVMAEIRKALAEADKPKAEAKPAPNQDPIKTETATDQDVTPDQPEPAPAQEAGADLEARQGRINAIGANAETRDWWNNGIAPPTRPFVLKDMGLFPGKEEYVGGRKWDDLSEDQRAQIVAATADVRAKRKAEVDAREAEIAKRTDAERERKAAAKAAQDEADKIASVSPLSSLRGGTAAAVLKLGDKSRIMDSAGYVGHGLFFMERGVDPAFDAAVTATGPVVDSISDGVLRIIEAARKAKEPVQWRFVRNTFFANNKTWRPANVVGFWDNSPFGGAKREWVALNPVLVSYIERKGLVVTAGADMGVLAVRKKDGTLVGAAGAVSMKGISNLDELDAIAQGEVTPPPAEVTPAQEEAPAPAPDQNEARSIDRSTDLRGVSFAVTNANGDVVTSGTNPALADLTDNLRAGYFMDMADQSGGALFVGPIAQGAAEADTAERIFGMTWAELTARQQGGAISRPVRSKMPDGAVEVYRANPTEAAPTATPDRNDEIGAALSKIETSGRGKKIADEFRAMLASEKDDLADTKKTQKASQDGSIYNEDVARVEARIADIEGRILSEAESIKEPKAEVEADKPAPKPASKSTDKIEDFGEKIGGARKDVWGGFKDRMDAAEALDVKAEPLSKSWPEPDYEKLIEAGVDAWTVGFVRAARESIPRKPSASWKLKPWVASVEALRKFAADLMNEKLSVAAVKAKVEESETLSKKVGNKIDLYMAVGHSKSLKDLKFSAASYSVKDGVYHSPSLVLWEVSKDRKATAFNNMPTVLTSATTKDEAIAKFKQVHKTLDDSGQKKGSRDKGAKFQIYGRKSGDGKVYTVETKIGKNSIVLRDGITDVDEARRILREEREQLQAQLDRMRDIPNERRDENAPRMGEDRRNGADITPEVFAETFGFRGIEFGNWVEQGRRQQDLNDAYDALMDMAAILDIPPKAVSLNGGLGLAFGARGKGGKNPAAAHFEPGKMVINMTKRAGRGSLAHEWFHALDNYFALKRKQSRGQYITENNAPAGPLTEGVRPETIEAFLAVKRAIANTKLKARSQEMDKTRTSPYWGTGIEMHARAFESYMLAKLADQNASNDYLVNVVDPAVWDALAAMQGLGDSYPYLKPDEIEGVRAAFDSLFRIMERRETDRGVAMEMRGPRGTVDPDEGFAAEIMREFAQVDDLFQNPVSSATSLANVFADIDPTIERKGILPDDDPRAEDTDAETITMFSTGKGKPFYVFETDEEVWIDVSDLGEGDGGSAVYSAISDYALNTGKVFIGDPAGLSETALRRRTENMLSTALKHGTTRHIAPHPYQLEGDKNLGVPALRWTEGEDEANVKALIKVSIASLVNQLPQVEDARYDFQSGTFRDAKGEPLSNEVLDGWASFASGVRAPRIGRNTVKRGILLNTLSRAEIGKQPGLLERSLRQSRQLVIGGGLSRTFYMRGPVSEPVASLTGQELGEWGDMRQLGRKAEAWYRDNLLGTTVKNDETGITIEFDNTGASKTAGRKGDILYRSVVALPQILKSGKLVASEPDRRGRKQIKAVHKFRADVQLDGEVYSLIATVRERTDGTFHYDLSKAADLGAKQPLDAGSEASASLRAGDEARFSSALEGDPVNRAATGQVSEARSSQAELIDTLNLEFASPEVNTDPAFTEDASRAVTRRLVAEVAKVLPGTKVGVRLVRQLYSLKDSKPIMGRANPDGSIEVSASAARDEAGAVGILNHEIVHVLRNADLWRSAYGLFKKGEWERLVRKAMSNDSIVKSVNERYKDKGLSAEKMQEEYVAELYRVWKRDFDDYGAVERILLKIEEFFKALASAFRGEGFDSAGMVMQRIADGTIGGRGPDGPGRGVRQGAMRAVPAEMRAGLRDQIEAAWNGSSQSAPIVLGRFPAVMRALTGKDHPFVVSSAVIRKAGSHGLTLNDVLAAIDGLDDPVMAFDSTNESGNLTVLVDTKAEDGRSMVVAVDAAFKAGRVEISRIATIHGKNNDGAIIGWMRDGYLRYINKRKADAWSRSIGRQLPKDGTTKHRQGKRILQHSDVFKGGMEMRAGGNPDPMSYPSVVSSISKLWSSKPATSEAALNAKEGGFVSNLITNAMAMNDKFNILGLVPGEVLFRDLGKNLPSAGKWVNTVRKMNAERQEMHAGADRLAREWLQIFSKDKKSGRALHDLMHESTIEGLDPSERFRAPRKPLDMTDAQYRNYVEDKRAKHAELKQKFNALPEAMQDVYRRVRDSYKDFDSMLIDAQVDAVVKAMGLQADRLKARYEDELQQFKDDGLEGDALKEAQKKARSRYNQDVKMLEFSRNARIRKMRLTYEANRIEGPYFPLMRFGQFFVAARNDKGKLVHFERASTAGAQQRIASEMRAQGLTVDTGVMKPDDNLSRFVDPNFVADITEAMGEAGADSQILDAIYQRYLETLPSFSIRKANIHRQGTPGYDKDAIKAFGSRMFHGAHQLTRLRHSMDLTKYIENAAREAKTQPDPTRAMAITNEMKKRHDWTMNPSGSSLSAWATSAMFVWYLGLTPAAAMVNVSQTTVVGVPIMAASIEGGTAAKASKHLLGALSDFTAGLKKGDAEWSRGALTSGRLNAEERKALQEAYNSGALDKSEGHDIAAIGDGGAEYSPLRERVMRPIAFLFHHAERLNREVTFLAAYRMAKEAGMEQEAAWRKAVDITWDTHFNYENWSRPRFMQHDAARVIFTFRQFQVNMLYRLFRDSHQALKSESPEVRKQARAQLIGITASMMLHAGITGTWGYALIMLLAGMFFEGGSDEAEEELKNAVVSTFGAGAGGLLLKGVPGHLTGTDMTARIGMPELWFRSPNRQLEGSDAYNHWVAQLLGPAGGIAENMFRGVELVTDGEVWRGAELMVPKAIRDQLRFVRYLNEGVTTYKGDPLLDDISAHDAIVQAIGFSPARVSERYEQNRRLMNAQVRIEDEKRKILADITRYIREGKEISPRALRRRDEFNQKYPTFAITPETIQRSFKARQRMSEQMDGGVRINPKLDRYLRENMAPSISQ
jgi:hypothetical protein